jgi:hypothetical protein
MKQNRKRLRLLGLALGLCVLTPLLLSFLCFPLVAPPPSGVVTPTPAALFAPTVSASVANASSGVPSDIAVHFSIPAGSTLAIGAVFDVPSGWTVANDGGVSDGSIVGSIAGSMTVADPFFYNCATQVEFNPLDVPPGDIKLLEATTNTSITVAGTDTDSDGEPEAIEDNNLNLLPDGVDKYPAFLTSLLPGTHRARYFGHTEAAGISDLFVNVIVTDLAPGGPYRVITIVNDPTAPPESATAQFCAPQSITMTLRGTSADNPATVSLEGGEALYTNPLTAGGYIFRANLVSEFDLDNDGIANGLDVCPAVPDASQADSDRDYVGDACDASPGTADFDVDGDGIENGYDNCIFTANPDQEDSDFDDIGDSCDAASAVPSGPNYYLTCTDPVGIGQGDPAGATCSQATPAPTPTPKDPDGDTDGDTIPNSADPDDDNDGCTDTQETSNSPAQGGRRNPHWFWDLMDVPTGSGLVRDKAVSGGDIAAVVGRFGSNDATPGDFDRNSDPLSAPNAVVSPSGARQNYHPAYDRGGATPGGDPWDLEPPNGAISGGDIAAAVAQFGHSCLMA